MSIARPLPCSSYASSLTLAGTRSSDRSRTTSTKPETSTTVEYPSLQLNQVATVSSGIPRIHAAQPLFRSLVEQDLRLAITDGLDELVRRGVSTVGTAAAVTGDILRKIRRGMTVVQSNGYNPNVPAIDPAGAESFDWLQSSAAEKFYVYGPGQGALRLFGVQMRVWKTPGPRCSTPMHSAACTSRQWSCAASRLMAG